MYNIVIPPPSPQHNTTQHNTTQHNTTQHNTTQHNTTQHNTTQQQNQSRILTNDFKNHTSLFVIPSVLLPYLTPHAPRSATTSWRRRQNDQCDGSPCTARSEVTVSERMMEHWSERGSVSEKRGEPEKNFRLPLRGSRCRCRCRCRGRSLPLPHLVPIQADSRSTMS